MIVQQTLTQLRALKLGGMASAFEEQLTLPTSGSLAFEDRFALLVEREHAHRNTHRLKRLLTKARLKYGQACLEDLDTRNRGLEAVRDRQPRPRRVDRDAAGPCSSSVPPGFGKT